MLFASRASIKESEFDKVNIDAVDFGDLFDYKKAAAAHSTGLQGQV